MSPEKDQFCDLDWEVNSQLAVLKKFSGALRGSFFSLFKIGLSTQNQLNAHRKTPNLSGTLQRK